VENSFEKTKHVKELFEQLFMIIRDQFLFNPKYGLDIYLSTRIRHGTLVNRLRNHFEDNHLVTNKSNERYLPNVYWTENFFKLKTRKYLLYTECIKILNQFSLLLFLV